MHLAWVYNFRKIGWAAACSRLLCGGGESKDVDMNFQTVRIKWSKNGFSKIVMAEDAWNLSEFHTSNHGSRGKSRWWKNQKFGQNSSMN